MNIQKLFFTLVILSCSLYAEAQKDKLIMINGITLTGKVLSLSQDSLKFSLAGKKEKINTFENYRIFAIEYEEGKRQILYYKDSLSGRDYSVKEMELFIKGEQDAYQYHKTLFPFVFSAALSATGSYLIGGDNFVILAVPFASALTSMLVLRPRIKREFITDKELTRDENYKTGYKRIAKVKRDRQIFLGSIVGTLAGIAIKAVSEK